MSRIPYFLTVAFVATVACNDSADGELADDPRCEKDLGEASVRFVRVLELCTGAWQEIQDGEELPFFIGPRGRWAVEIGVLAEGIYFGDWDGCNDPSHPSQTVEVRLDGEELYSAASNCWSCGHPQEHFFEVADWNEDVAGRTLTLEAEAVDMCRRHATATVNLELMPAEGVSADR